MSVWDGISDIPQAHEIGNYEIESFSTRYVSERGQSFYQRLMRQNNGKTVEDCITRTNNALMKLRITLVPKEPGADWRDLPNARKEYKDGKVTKIAKELHYGIKDVSAREEKYK